MLDHAALSALDWWQEAGVDALVDEQPRDWLAPLVSRAPAVAHTVQAAAAPAPAPVLPETLAAFQAWLLTDPSVPGRPSHRLGASGDVNGGTMIVVDAPESGDRDAGHVLAGEPGALFERMLQAIGLAREAVYLAPFAPARPAGRLDPAAADRLAGLMRHHLSLVKPKRVLLLGDAPARALLGSGFAAARGRVHEITFPGGETRAVASLHPRMIADTQDAIQRKDRRAAAWADLQLFASL